MSSAAANRMKERVDQFYIPIYNWMTEQMRQSSNRNTFLIGIQCVQGGGKTTLTNALEKLFEFDNTTCAVLSLDDVYYTHSQQLALAEKFPNDPLLQYRGNPGTHDIDLAMQTIRRIRNEKTGTIALPRYDKSAFSGRGDRFPLEKWSLKKAPVDVLLVEGWCLGFQHRKFVDDRMKNVNQALKAYEQLYKALDAMVVLKVQDVEWVYRWREEAEERLRLEKKPAMTKTQIRDFVDRFIPTYNVYLPTLYDTSQRESCLNQIPRLNLGLDINRKQLVEFPQEGQL